MGGKTRIPDTSKKATPQQILGQVLRQRRLDLGLSQRELATMTDLERSTVTYLESGARAPSIPTLFEIARALEILPSDLLVAVEMKIGLIRPK